MESKSRIWGLGTWPYLNGMASVHAHETHEDEWTHPDHFDNFAVRARAAMVSRRLSHQLPPMP